MARGTFSPEQMESLSRMGEGIAGVLQDRYYRKELENFMQGEYADYRQSLLQLQQTMLQNPDKPDIVSDTLLQYQQLNMNLFNTSVKYGKNNYISDIVQRHMNHDMQQMGNMVNMFEAAGKLARAPEERERAVRMEEAKIGGMEAEAEQRIAGAEESRARAGLLREETRLAPMEAAAKARGEAKGIQLYTQQAPMGNVPVARALIGRQMAEKGLQIEMQDLITAEARKVLAQERKNPESYLNRIYTGEGTATGVGDPPGALEAAKQMVDVEKVKKQLEINVMLREGYTPDMIVQQAPDLASLVDPQSAIGTRLPPLTGEQAPLMVGSRMLGPVAMNLPRGTNFNSAKAIAAELPDDLSDLGTGEFQSTLALIWNNQGEVPFQPGTQFPNYKSLADWYIAATNDQIDREIEDDKLKKQARTFRDATMEKYLTHIARQLGLGGVPKLPHTPTYLPEGLLKVSPTARGIESLLKGTFESEL